MPVSADLFITGVEAQLQLRRSDWGPQAACWPALGQSQAEGRGLSLQSLSPEPTSISKGPPRKMPTFGCGSGDVLPHFVLLPLSAWALPRRWVSSEFFWPENPQGSVETKLSSLPTQTLQPHRHPNTYGSEAIWEWTCTGIQNGEASSPTYLLIFKQVSL